MSSFGSLLAASLMAGYVLVGFDSAGELSEETHNPRRTAPRTILRALIVLRHRWRTDPPRRADGRARDRRPSSSTGGLAYVVTARLGDVWGRVFLADVVLAAFVCTLAIQTATTRMIYSMSRDEVLPFSRPAHRLRRGATVYAAVVVGVGAAALLLINLGHSGVFTALTSTCIVLLYLAYLCVTVPMLYRRLKGWPAELGPQNDETGNPVFSLGRWGLPVNILAVAWGIAMAINLAWPRQEVYDPDGSSLVLQYFGILIVALTVLGGIVAFNVKKKAYRQAIGLLPSSHSPAEADEEPVPA